ncbi:MAG: hypothetical protein QNM02_01610 [Acidimicrobiia bacterium]|nr:hypothetical protein [Acidimicrobiia bacterium]
MPTVSDERIEPTLHALLAGDAEGLRTALADDPELVRERGLADHTARICSDARLHSLR